MGIFLRVMLQYLLLSDGTQFKKWWRETTVSLVLLRGRRLFHILSEHSLSRMLSVLGCTSPLGLGLRSLVKIDCRNHRGDCQNVEHDSQTPMDIEPPPLPPVPESLPSPLPSPPLPFPPTELVSKTVLPGPDNAIIWALFISVVPDESNLNPKIPPLPKSIP